jgi:hypothetical protein
VFSHPDPASFHYFIRFVLDVLVWVRRMRLLMPSSTQIIILLKCEYAV